METIEKTTYATIDLWRHAQNVKTRNRRLRKQATATRQNKGQRARHNRRGAPKPNTKRAMSSRSWRH